MYLLQTRYLTFPHYHPHELIFFIKLMLGIIIHFDISVRLISQNSPIIDDMKYNIKEKRIQNMGEQTKNM